MQNTPGETKKVENATMYAVRMEINSYLNNTILYNIDVHAFAFIAKLYFFFAVLFLDSKLLSWRRSGFSLPVWIKTERTTHNILPKIEKLEDKMQYYID